MNLNDYAEEIYRTCEEKGWNNDGRTEGDFAALAHSEISEAFESIRKNELLYFVKDGKPEGAAIEYIDCIIRILHWMKHHNINPDIMIQAKMEYNKTRSYRHGNKKI